MFGLLPGRKHVPASWMAFICCHFDGIVIRLASWSQPRTHAQRDIGCLNWWTATIVFPYEPLPLFFFFFFPEVKEIGV